MVHFLILLVLPDKFLPSSGWQRGVVVGVNIFICISTTRCHVERQRNDTSRFFRDTLPARTITPISCRTKQFCKFFNSANPDWLRRTAFQTITLQRPFICPSQPKIVISKQSNKSHKSAKSKSKILPSQHNSSLAVPNILVPAAWQFFCKDCNLYLYSEIY